MSDTRRRRNGEIAIGVLLLLVGLAALTNEAFPAVLLIGIGAWMLWRRFGNGSVDFSSILGAPSLEDGESDVELDDIAGRQTGAEKVYAHALRAVEKVGLNPDEVSVLPVDIGFMV